MEDNVYPNFPKDWPEDFDQENGMYENQCKVCNEFFLGNKHRRTCKECYDNSIEGERNE